MSKTFLFQTTQFSKNYQFSSIWPIDRALSGATTPDQSWPGSDGNEGVLRIPQSSSITGTSTSDCLISYPGHLLGGVLPVCRETVGVFNSYSRRAISLEDVEDAVFVEQPQKSWGLVIRDPRVITVSGKDYGSIQADLFVLLLMSVVSHMLILSAKCTARLCKSLLDFLLNLGIQVGEPMDYT